MTRVEITEKLKRLFSKTFGEDVAESITDETQATNVDGWDSFTYMAIIGEIENAFQIHLHYRDIASFDKVGDIVDCLERNLK